MIRIREALAVATGAATVLAAMLACKPKSSSTETTTSSSAPSGTLAPSKVTAWCPVAGYATAGFTSVPVATTYVGITAAVKTGALVKSALLSDVTVSALAIGPGKARVTSIKPDNESEKKELAATALAVAAALKGESAGPVHVGKGLAGFLDGLKTDLPAKGYAVTASTGKPASFAAANPSEIAFVTGKVDAYVVIERATDGTWMNVYPARKYLP